MIYVIVILVLALILVNPWLQTKRADQQEYFLELKDKIEDIQESMARIEKKLYDIECDIFSQSDEYKQHCADIDSIPYG